LPALSSKYKFLTIFYHIKLILPNWFMCGKEKKLHSCRERLWE